MIKYKSLFKESTTFYPNIYTPPNPSKFKSFDPSLESTDELDSQGNFESLLKEKRISMIEVPFYSAFCLAVLDKYDRGKYNSFVDDTIFSMHVDALERWFEDKISSMESVEFKDAADNKQFLTKMIAEFGDYLSLTYRYNDQKVSKNVCSLARFSHDYGYEDDLAYVTCEVVVKFNDRNIPIDSIQATFTSSYDKNGHYGGDCINYKANYR